MTDKEIIEKAGGKRLDDKVKHLSLRKLQGLQSFSPLKNCTKLEYLLLRADGTIPPLAPLVHCPNLEVLAIRENPKIKSLTFLEQMPQLKKLELNKRLYELLNGLSPQLNILEVCSPTIEQVDYFRNFSQLKELELGTDTGIYTKINNDTNFTPVAQLHRLFLMSRLMTSTKQLAVLKECRSLFIGSNKKLTDLSGLKSLTKLEALVVNRTAVKDLLPLNDLSINYLAAGGTKINSLENLVLPELIQLYLGQIRLKKLSLNTAFPKLELLSLSQTGIKDIQQIGKLSALKYLSLWGCTKLMDFSPILELNNLEAIDLSESLINIEQFDQIAAMPNMKKMAIYKSAIALDETNLEKAKEVTQKNNTQLVTERSELLDFQKPYYRLMNYYLHVYKGKENPWFEDWQTGYHI